MSSKCLHDGYETWITIDNKTCFWFSNYFQIETWHDAEQKCQSSGSHLISIHDPIVNAFIPIYAKRSNSYPATYWLGLNSLQQRMNYQWTDETPNDYNNFTIINSTRVQDVAYTQGRCVSVRASSGQWEHQDCNDRTGLICQKTDFTSDNRIQTTPIPLGNCPSGK